MAISSGELSSVMLIVGALVALAIAVFGRKGLKEGKKDTEFNKKLRIVSGVTGLAMIGWAFLMIYEDTWTQFLMLLMFILLGIGLMLPVLPRTNLGTIIALLIAAFVGYMTFEYVDMNNIGLDRPHRNLGGFLCAVPHLQGGGGLDHLDRVHRRVQMGASGARHVAIGIALWAW